MAGPSISSSNSSHEPSDLTCILERRLERGECSATNAVREDDARPRGGGTIVYIGLLLAYRLCDFVLCAQSNTFEAALLNDIQK